MDALVGSRTGGCRSHTQRDHHGTRIGRPADSCAMVIALGVTTATASATADESVHRVLLFVKSASVMF